MTLRRLHVLAAATLSLLRADRAYSIIQHRGVLVVCARCAVDADAVRSVIDFVYQAVQQREELRRARVANALSRAVFILTPSPIEVNDVGYSLLVQRLPRLGVIIGRVQVGVRWAERLTEAIAGVIVAEVFPGTATPARSSLRAAERASLGDAAPTEVDPAGDPIIPS